MTKTEIKRIVSDSINPRKLCDFVLEYESKYRCYFPLKTSDKLFLGAEHYDFFLDGYSVRRYRDVKQVKFPSEKILEIIEKEGIAVDVKTPEIDVSNWYTVFCSLKDLGKNIIVENEYSGDFVIGRIEKVTKSKVYLLHFDGDGVWQDEQLEIPFSKITSVSFCTRYAETFSKYV